VVLIVVYLGTTLMIVNRILFDVFRYLKKYRSEHY